MKLLDVNWLSIIAGLDRWASLPRAARRILLDELKPSGYVPADRLEPHLRDIVSSGIPAHDLQRQRVWLGDDQRALVKVLRAMDRHRLFDEAVTPGDDPGAVVAGLPIEPRVALIRYMEEHFTNEEIEGLGSAANDASVWRVTREYIAPLVASARWAGEMLDANGDSAILTWARVRGLDVMTHRTEALRVLRALQELLRRLLKSPEGVPLRQLVLSARTSQDIADLASALHAGLRTLVIFAGMTSGDFEPTVGLWPPAARELLRPAPTKPSVVPVSERFELAVGMEDMTTLLAAIVAAPVRVRASDLAVFARARTEVEKRLVTLPAWVAPLYPSARVDHAARELQMHGFARIASHRTTPRLEATPAGSRWLALPPRDRLATLLDEVRNSNEVNPRSSYLEEPGIGFFPYALPYARPPESLRLRTSLTRAFLSVGEGFTQVPEFLEYFARAENPLLSLISSTPARKYESIFYTGAIDIREAYRDVWRSMLSQFLASRLFAWGGVTVGRTAAGSYAFGLTDIGRYLFGNASTFDYGGGDGGDVVIQPNFDVVFLGAAPSVEAEIARFAERVGAAPGLAFRITRASVLAAAEGGAVVSDVVGALTRASSKPVPKNVQREIAGWMGAVRRASLRRAELLECADADGADRVAALLGDRLRQWTPTVFELVDTTPTGRTTVLKALRAGGVFIDWVKSPRNTKRGARLNARDEDLDDE